MSAVRVRFAPSPTGKLHLGGLRTALFNFLFARQNGGSFILRLEDTDQKRYQPGSLENILQTLRWAKISPDEGPGIGGGHGPYIQSERLPLYRHFAEKLLDEGSAYRCFCSSARLDMLGRAQRRRRETPGYDRKCRHLSDREVAERLRSQTPHVIRFKMDGGEERMEDLVMGKIWRDPGKTESDPVILKSDGFPVYHLANVVDDHLMEISHVIRGVEWLPSLAKHVRMYKAFKWTPPVFAHVPLLVSEGRLKLSKRSPDHHKYEMQAYFDRGYLPETVLNWMLRSGGGFGHDRPWFCGMSLAEMTDAFRLDKLQTVGAELNWPALDLCGLAHFSQLSASAEGRATMVEELRRRFEVTVDYSDEEQRKIFQGVLSNRMRCYADFDSFRFIWTRPRLDATLVDTLCAQCPLSDSIPVLQRVADGLGASEDIPQLLGSLPGARAAVMRLLRLALVGLKDGPRVADLLEALPPAEAKARVDAAMRALEARSQDSHDSRAGDQT